MASRSLSPRSGAPSSSANLRQRSRCAASAAARRSRSPLKSQGTGRQGRRSSSTLSPWSLSNICDIGKTWRSERSVAPVSRSRTSHRAQSKHGARERHGNRALPLSRLHDIIADGEADEFAETREVHFVHDVIAVAFDRPRRNAERRGYFLVALSLRLATSRLRLSRGVSGELGSTPSSPDRRIVARPANVVLRHRNRQPAGKKWLVVTHVIDSGEKLGVCVGLQDVAERAAAQHFPRQLFGEVHRENQDVGRRRFVANLRASPRGRSFPASSDPGRADPAFLSLHNPSPRGPSKPPRKPESRLRLKQHAQAMPHHRVVVRNQNPIRFGRHG